LVVGLAAALPGFMLIFLRYKGPIFAAALVATLAASPTIGGTLLGLADKDDFLTYREASSNALGVPPVTGLLAAAVPILMLGLILWAGVAYKNASWQAFSVGAGTAWALVASNDLWGANQEPYRFWIDSFTIVTAAAVPVICQILLASWNARSVSASFQLKSTFRRHVGSTESVASPERRQAVVTGMACLALLGSFGISLLDYASFSRYVHSEGTESFHNPQGMAIETAVLPLTESGSELRAELNDEGQASKLLLGDPCVNPFQLKSLTGLPVAFYNLGLAWPKNEPHVRELLKQRASGGFAQPIARNAGVEYVITDSSCSANWQNQIDAIAVSATSYTAGDELVTITLWRFND